MNNMAIRSALVLVGDQDDGSLRTLAEILDKSAVPYKKACGITAAVAAADEWIQDQGADQATTIDFIGHAERGKFYFGNGQILSSCPDSYALLGSLRDLIAEPKKPGTGAKWGLRLLGCDVSNDDYSRDNFAMYNGTVLQFALSWFLQMPVWAPRGALLGRHFENKDRRVQYRDLVGVSLGAALNVPKRPKPGNYGTQVSRSFDRSVEGPEIIPGDSILGESLGRFDFDEPRDASDLLVDITKVPRIEIPKALKKDLKDARLLFGQSILLVTTKTGQKIAYPKISGL